VLYGPSNDVYFVGGQRPSLFLYKVSRPGDAPQKIIADPANYLYAVSPDDRWVAAWVGVAVAFYPTDGTAPRIVCGRCGTAGEEQRGVTPPLIRWSSDGHRLYMHSTISRTTYVVQLPTGTVIPPLPDQGYFTIDDAAKALGGKPIADQRAYVSDAPDIYAFPKVSSHRNIYRVSLQ
jgi:hypothetical protein